MQEDKDPTQENQPVVQPSSETPPENTQGVDGDDDTVVVTIGDGEPAAGEDENAAPAWVKELRKTNREQAKRLRELEQERIQRQAATEAPVELPKPTLEGCDYDTDVFEQKFAQWTARQAEVAEARRKSEEAQKAEIAAWTSKLENFGKAKAELKVPDFEDAEATAASMLSQVQAAIIVSGAENSAQVIYALGKNPEEAKKLAAIHDPIKFAFAVAKLETKLKVTPRKIAPAPERRIGGTSTAGGSSDQNLERLRAEGAKTGDMSKAIAYKRSLKAKAA